MSHAPARSEVGRAADVSGERKSTWRSAKRVASRLRAGRGALVVVLVASSCSWLSMGATGAPRQLPIPRCATSQLVVWLFVPSGNAAAGSRYFALAFTNVSRASCTLTGYPGVSYVNSAGAQLGSAAGHMAPAGRTVRLAAGATASADLREAAQGIIASPCTKVTAAGVRVYPPNQTASKMVPFPFQTCSNHGPVYLHVGAVGQGNISVTDVTP